MRVYDDGQLAGSNIGGTSAKAATTRHNLIGVDREAGQSGNIYIFDGCV